MAPLLSLKTNYSIYHLNGAAYFARCVAKIEENYKTSISEELKTEYFSNVTASILMSVAALESRINEVYLSAVDSDPNVFKNVGSWIIDALQEIWPNIEDKPTLTKYQIALIISRKDKFDKGLNPFQDAARLIGLRNALVHYKPEWDTELKEHKKLESSLNGRFPISPFSNENDSFFPKKCIGHGCAAWAVKTSIEFITSFYDRLGIERAFHLSNNFETT